MWIKRISGTLGLALTLTLMTFAKPNDLENCFLKPYKDIT